MPLTARLRDSSPRRITLVLVLTSSALVGRAWKTSYAEVEPHQSEQRRQLALRQVVDATLSPNITAASNISLMAAQFCQLVVDQGLTTWQ